MVQLYKNTRQGLFRNAAIVLGFILFLVFSTLNFLGVTHGKLSPNDAKADTPPPPPGPPGK